MHNSEINTDILIVGGGPAGIQATRTIKEIAPKLRVTVLRPEPYSVIYCAIPYAIERLIDMSTIAKRDELITDVGAELLKTAAVSVDLDAHLVTTQAGQAIHFGKLLVATGAVPFVPPVDGHDLDNIMTVKTRTDAEMISDAADKASRAVVVGAGAIGIEQAQALRRRGLEVDLIDMADYPLPTMIDGDFGQQVQDWLVETGIVWRGGAKVSAFAGDSAVSSVELDDGTSIELEEGKDIVIVCVGVRAELGPFADTPLERETDGLLVDDQMRTNLPDVWAAGDCVHFVSGIDGKSLSGKLATNAVPMAKIAAQSMLGIPARYPGFFNGAVTCVADWRIGATGFTEAFAQKRAFTTIVGRGETTSRFPMMPGARKVQVKLVADVTDGRIIGGQILGPEAVAERIDLITLVIQQRMTAADLSQLSYSAQPWQSFFPARNAIVQAAEGILKAQALKTPPSQQSVST